MNTMRSWNTWLLQMSNLLSEVEIFQHIESSFFNPFFRYQAFAVEEILDIRQLPAR